MEPFHRLFILDDINLHYPHTLVERVPVCKALLITSRASAANFHSLEYRICGSASVYSPQYLACNLEIQSAQSTSYTTRVLDFVSAGWV